MPKADPQRLHKWELSETECKLLYFIKSKKPLILKCSIILSNTHTKATLTITLISCIPISEMPQCGEKMFIFGRMICSYMLNWLSDKKLPCLGLIAWRLVSCKTPWNPTTERFSESILEYWCNKSSHWSATEPQPRDLDIRILAMLREGAGTLSIMNTEAEEQRRGWGFIMS